MNDQRDRKALDQTGRELGPRALQTRQRLLDATKDLLSQRSVRDIRVVEIARKVGTSPATFYQYFKDVEDAILCLAEMAAEEIPAIIELIDGSWQPQRGLATSRSIADAFVRHWDAHESVLRVRNLKAEEGDRRFRKMRLATLSPVVERLAARIEESQKADQVSPEMNSLAAAAAVLAMLERMASYQTLWEHAGITRSQLVETCARILYQTITGRQAP